MIEMYERSPRAISWQAVGDLATTCLPSRLSRVRVPSPALLCTLSLCKPVTSRLATTRQRLSKQGDDVFMCQKACSDILPLAPNAARLPPGAKEAVKEAITHERERVEEIISTAGIWKGHAQTPQARRQQPRRRPARQARRAGPSARATGHSKGSNSHRQAQAETGKASLAGVPPRRNDPRASGRGLPAGPCGRESQRQDPGVAPHGSGAPADVPWKRARHYPGGRDRCPRYQRLVRRDAHESGEPRQASERAHHPDLRPLGTRLLPLAGTPRDPPEQPL